MTRDGFRIRRATPADDEIIAHHRAAMFLEMGSLTPSDAPALEAATVAWLRAALPRGEYLGWLAEAGDGPGRVVSGAGVQIRRVLPFPRRSPDGRTTLAEGRQAIVVNVYTEPEFRRRGLARRLMETVLGWARSVELESLVLHAAPAGKELYESLGFAQTNEMRFMGDLSVRQSLG